MIKHFSAACNVDVKCHSWQTCWLQLEDSWQDLLAVTAGLMAVWPLRMQLLAQANANGISSSAHKLQCLISASMLSTCRPNHAQQGAVERTSSAFKKRLQPLKKDSLADNVARPFQLLSIQTYLWVLEW